MQSDVSRMDPSRRVAAGGLCLLAAGLAALLGWLVQYGNDWVRDSSGRPVGVVVQNELGDQLGVVFLALSSYLFVAAAIGISGAFRGRGAALTYASTLMLGIGGLLPGRAWTTGGPLQRLEAYRPPPGVTAATVITVTHHQTDPWSFAALGLVLPCFMLAPLVLGVGLFQSRMIPIWPVLLWPASIIANFLPLHSLSPPSACR